MGTNKIGQSLAKCYFISARIFMSSSNISACVEKAAFHQGYKGFFLPSESQKLSPERCFWQLWAGIKHKKSEKQSK